MWWQDNWRDTLVQREMEQPVAISFLTRLRKQCEASPKTRSPFHIVSSVASQYDTRRKVIWRDRHVEEYCLKTTTAQKEWVTIYPPGRHWLDLDIQHSWHRKNSAPHWKQIPEPFFDPVSFSSFFPLLLVGGLVVWAESVLSHRQTERL